MLNYHESLREILQQQYFAMENQIFYKRDTIIFHVLEKRQRAPPRHIPQFTWWPLRRKGSQVFWGDLVSQIENYNPLNMGKIFTTLYISILSCSPTSTFSCYKINNQVKGVFIQCPWEICIQVNFPSLTLQCFCDGNNKKTRGFTSHHWNTREYKPLFRLIFCNPKCLFGRVSVCPGFYTRSRIGI